MNVYEMEGFLRGKCLPGDIKVNESNAEYLVRKLNAASELQGELTAALATIEKFREITGCPVGVGLQDHLRKLVADNEKAMDSLRQADAAVKLAHEKFSAIAAENVALKGALTGSAYISFIKANGWNASASTVNGKFVNFADPEVDFGSMVFAHAKKLIDDIKTPATNAAIAGIKADGVEEFAKKLESRGRHQDYVKVAYAFAQQLREGAK
ncbi:hypothetical protein [Raoultella planticola]|uniref:hypothetical protein n=1 Tax=Raoultella planticola TaxID=575 RepID=UPI003A4DF864